MAKPTTIAELQESIVFLEAKQVADERLLKEQIAITFESIKPINLIKSSFKDFISSPDLKENLLRTVMSMAVGYLSKKATIGSTHNPLKKLLGTFLQLGVTNVVSNNSENIKTVIMNLLGNFLKKKDPG